MADISATQWQQLSPLLDELLEAEHEERARRLAQIRCDDEALANRLETLIEQRTAVERELFLEGGAAFSMAQEPSLVGQIVGAYTLREPIGHGGMGSVWRAERSDGRYEATVAIKFLNLALQGHGGVERFAREGNMLARLSHPNIARLLDAGVAAGSQPYLVLEFIDGVPIDSWCDARSLGIDARVRLFLDVLTAVAHAHSNLILHRDLKPSNILITPQGQVKLLDFGIGKLIEDQSGAASPTELTQLAGRAFTPDFAAPEQVTHGGVTTATDVYTLGVLLCLLLTGRHPTARPTDTQVDRLRAVVEADPLRPSDAIARATVADAASAASDRATTGPRLMRALRGDLDNIVTKALKKSPDERYQTVAALADDLRRHFNHEPISARRDAMGYRIVKFVRRNRLAVAAGALIVIALSAGMLVANRERAAAQRQFVQVRQLANKLFEIDAQVRQLPGSTKTRQLIVDTSLEYLRRLTVDAGTDLDLALEVGTAYMRVARVQGVPISPNLGQRDPAEQNLQIAETIIDSVLAAQPANRTAILRSAQIAHDRMIFAGDRRPDDAAIVFARKSAQRLEQYLQSGPWAEGDQVALAYMNVAQRYMLAGEVDEGIRMTRRTIEIAKEASEPRQAGGALIQLSRGLRLKGDLDGALVTAEEAVKTLTPSAPDAALGMWTGFALALSTQAQILAEDGRVSLGRRDEAIPLYERAVKIAEDLARQDTADSHSRFSVAETSMKLAALLRETDPARSLDMYDHVLRRLGEITNNSRARRWEARALAGASDALVRLGRAAEARQRLDGAFERLLQLKLYPAEQVALGSEPDDALRALATYEATAGHPARAIEVYQDLLNRIMAGKPKPETDLRNAAELSSLYASLAQLERRAGNTAAASSLETRRLQLWSHWVTRLPGNSFVARQLSDASATH
ncbi:MAG: protein kinase [Burkholderiaceae bacterium]